MNYKKPQSTLVHGSVGIYPLTTADQVILADGSRLEKDGKISADSAADSAKLGGKAPEYYIQPRNLLDNSDFANPVNQRGQTSYEIAAGTYNIDRWVNWLETSDITSHVIVQDGYITVETGGKLQQKLASYKQNTIYTAAAKRTDGTVLIVSGMFSNVEIGEDIFIKTGSDGIANVGLRSGDYLWIALYEGAYTSDTLPPYVPKGYAAELVECQRYYQIIKSGFPIIGTSYTTGTSSANVRFPLPIKMRKNPAVTADATQIGVVDKGNTPLASSATFSMTNNSLDMSLKFSSAVFEKSFISVSPYSAVDIQLSADL